MHLFKLVVPVVFALALLSTNATHASEGSGARSFGNVSAKGLLAFSEISAAQKKKKRTSRTQAVPSPGPSTSGWGGWRPADPSFDQYGRPYQPPPGLSCPVDLGYGRWGSCNNDY